ncbi:UDP-3-O-(3-hydroxymyristoyl)glucosamine N-acyltransferase [Klebsiella pneumoniae]|uniref:UDP-3-O-(3-hydroxymyristoyl)glucosamine N-acyltransferase n=1 Tax=Klebsiella pneumoniae TaxID=573 RepID=UPI001EE9290B|nr:UDP-3-O-(3-hydroxymyristoyl)glucosamine N-acyltransferase [Klebsiella pneumoniae]MCG5575383.1 UDP-3-O-(3-hydroxymyristoyl)glucosamine N-acyltransferase [Klebsiella pneumoniae]
MRMFNVVEIASLIEGHAYGDLGVRVDCIRPVLGREQGGLAIIFKKNDLNFLPECNAEVIVGPSGILNFKAKAYIVIPFLNVDKINLLLRQYKVRKYKLYDQGNTSGIADVYIGKHCRIGTGCHFMPGVKILNGVTIGNNVAINCNTVIKEGTIIGDNVTIDSNNSIGNYSFEYMATVGNSYQRVESIGRVIIHDFVEIGANNTIDRGTLGDTIIGMGTKLDNQIQIGHDCKIGSNCLIVSQVGFSGHTVLGDYVIVQGQVGTAGNVSIGSHSTIKAKSGVSHSFPENSDIFGYPATDSRTYFKNVAVLKKLAKELQK